MIEPEISLAIETITGKKCQLRAPPSRSRKTAAAIRLVVRSPHICVATITWHLAVLPMAGPVQDL